MGPLRIGVNALYLIPGGVGGTEIYLRNLLTALSEIDQLNEYIVFTNIETGADLVPQVLNFTLAQQRLKASFRPARLLWEQTELASETLRHRLDVLLNPGFTAPFVASCPSVTVFHDLQHKRHPEHFRWFDLPFWRFFLWGSAHRSKRLIADSEATRRDVLHYYRVPAEKIIVAPLGVGERFHAISEERRARAARPRILCVSTLHPHKNLDRLVRAFAVFQKRWPDFTLVIAGLRGFYAQALEHTIAEQDLGERVRLTGWIPQEELYELYRDAFAFIYPSTFEGFGLPVLEALAAGIPTACSNIAPLQEIAGDSALMFDPASQDELVRAMERLVSDDALRSRLRDAGPARAMHFSWRRTAQATLSVLQSTAARA
jgi:glycosyltransferase involved in cell wall biosynthesis